MNNLHILIDGYPPGDGSCSVSWNGRGTALFPNMQKNGDSAIGPPLHFVCRRSFNDRVPGNRSEPAWARCIRAAKIFPLRRRRPGHISSTHSQRHSCNVQRGSSSDGNASFMGGAICRSRARRALRSSLADQRRNLCVPARGLVVDYDNQLKECLRDLEVAKTK